MSELLDRRNSFTFDAPTSDSPTAGRSRRSSNVARFGRQSISENPFETKTNDSPLLQSSTPIQSSTRPTSASIGMNSTKANSSSSDPIDIMSVFSLGPALPTPTANTTSSNDGHQRKSSAMFAQGDAFIDFDLFAGFNNGSPKVQSQSISASAPAQSSILRRASSVNEKDVESDSDSDSSSDEEDDESVEPGSKSAKVVDKDAKVAHNKEKTKLRQEQAFANMKRRTSLVAPPTDAQEMLSPRSEALKSKGDVKPKTEDKKKTHMRVDVLSNMKRGTPFLKYGQIGFPHFRLFVLSPCHRYIQWFSQNKSLRETCLDLTTVRELIFGQKTAVFARQRSPELEKSSFSLVYGRGGSKSLDLIAKDPNDFRMWTEGIRQILKMIRNNQLNDVNRMRRMIITLPMLPGRRSSSEIIDVDSNLDANQFYTTDEVEYTSNSYLNGAKQGGKVDLNQDSLLHDKNGYKQVQSQLKETRAKYERRKLQMTGSAVIASPFYALLNHINVRVGDSIKRAIELYNDGRYALCEDELWRIGVDLEAWKNCVASVQ